MTQVACPDAQLLHRLLTGELDEVEAQPLEQHLCQCPLCVAQAEGLPVDDPLLRDARRRAQEGTRIRVPPPVLELIGQLRKLPFNSNPTAALLCRAIERAVQVRPPLTPNPSPPRGEGRKSADPSPPRGEERQGPDPSPQREEGRKRVDAPWPRTGRYRLLRPLGHGGMGTVYLAEDPQLGRQVAVKVPRFGLPPEAEAIARQRFLREARLAAAVSHPNVCSIHDVGEEADEPFVVLAYVAGGSLAERLQHGKTLEVRQAVTLAVQVAEGLAAIHARDIVHRDLKPGNVLLDGDGKALVTDFGLARGESTSQHLTVEGTVLGTPPYMAPEQIDHSLGAVDRRCDLYSLGVVLYQMLTGRLPFEATEPHRLLYQIVHATLPPPTLYRPALDPALASLVMKALARRPDERFQDAGELAAILRGWLEAGQAIRVSPPSQSLPHPQAASITAVPPAGLSSPAPVPRNRSLARLRWLLPRAFLGLAFGAVLILPGGQPPGSNAPLNGGITVKLWPAKYKNEKALLVNDYDALPLGLADEAEFLADLNRPAFLYVIHINSEGKTIPIYPWRKKQWDQRPKQEFATKALWLPNGGGDRWRTCYGPAGLETVLLLGRETPLPQEVNLEWALGDVPPIPLKGSRPVAWFHRWSLLEGNGEGYPPLPAAGNYNDAPLIDSQRLLQSRVGRYFDFSSAVTFSATDRPLPAAIQRRLLNTASALGVTSGLPNVWQLGWPGEWTIKTKPQ